MRSTIPNPVSREAGFVPEVMLRIILVLLVLGQVVYLSSRYRVRVDLTADGIYTLTDSTRRVLEGLEDRLLIECYFSKEERLPAVYRPLRRQLDNFLDEYAELSNGKVVIVRLDPQDDELIREKAQRLGIEPITMSDPGEASFTVKEIWQGMRLMYGADKQEVIPLVDFRDRMVSGRVVPATAVLEAQLTPKIKALTVLEKPKVGLIAYPTEASGGRQPFGGGGQSVGFNRIAALEGIKGRYDVQNVSLDEGQLVPDEFNTLLLVRPKNLTDRQKYAIDQFLMRGGNLVVFADTNEYEIGQRRSFTGRKVSYDAPDAKLKFTEQLAAYGVEVDDRVIGDALQNALEPFTIPRQTVFGVVGVPVRYPYWFHPLDIDYAAEPAPFVGLGKAGASPEELAELTEQYRKTFKPGAMRDSELLEGMERLPGFFWPCPVDAAETLPEGVTGDTILRSSPASWAEPPPPDLNPLGFDRNPVRQNQALQVFQNKWQRKLLSEPRQQFGLAVHLRGSFTSFFAGKESPERPKKDEPAAPANGAPGFDPLEAPVGVPPTTGGKKGDGGDGGLQGQGEKKTEAPQGKAEQPQKGEGEVSTPDPAGPPPSPSVQGPDEDKDPEPILDGQPAQLIVIGDSDFVRDDLLPDAQGNYQYAQFGGPVSPLGAVFLANLLDVLAGDRDLLALRNKTAPDRTIRFLEADPTMDQQEFAEAVKERGTLIRWINIIAPVLAILVIWVLVSVRRRAIKQSFMAATGA